MRIVTGPRRSGKTTEAIRIADRNDAILVTHTAEAARRAKDMAREMGRSISAMSYHQFFMCHTMGTNKSVVIDNLEYFLQYLAREMGAESVEAVTMTPGVRVDLATREGHR